MFDTNPCYLLQTAPGLPCQPFPPFSPLFLFTAAQLTCLKKNPKTIFEMQLCRSSCLRM